MGALRVHSREIAKQPVPDRDVPASALLARQRPDGSFVDNRLDAESPNSVAHTTLVALLAFARSAA